MQEDGKLADNGLIMEEHYDYHAYQNNNPSNKDAEIEVGLELQEQQNMKMKPWNNQRGKQTIQELVQQQSDEANHVLPYNHQSNWEIDMSYHHHHQESYDAPLPETPYNPNMFPLPGSSLSTDLLQNPPISFANSAQKLELFTSPALGGMVAPAAAYETFLPLNLPLQPPMFRDLLMSLPQGYYSTLGDCSRSMSLFNGIDADRYTINGGVYQDGVERPFNEGVLEFTSVNDEDYRKHTKPFAEEKQPKEKQRRVHINDSYTALKNLVPNPTKGDKASIVQDAIGYIEQLKRTVNKLKILVEKKRGGEERIKRHKTEDGAEIITLVKTQDFDGQASSGLRTSWLQRKSKNTEVDVRIIDDEVTVKLVQQKRVNCLLFVSKVFDEFQLDFHHISGGLIGDHYSFLFNSKIHEGSTVYARAIANKLIGEGDTQYTAVPTTISY